MPAIKSWNAQNHSMMRDDNGKLRNAMTATTTLKGLIADLSIAAKCGVALRQVQQDLRTCPLPIPPQIQKNMNSKKRKKKN